MKQFISATKGQRNNLKCWEGGRREEGLKVLLPFYLLLGEIDLHGLCLSSLSDNETRDETEKEEIQQSTRQESNNLPW